MLKRLTIMILFVVGAGIAPAMASSCLQMEETRHVVAQKDLVSLQEIVRSVRSAHDAELISARLCETNGNMVYMIALLGKNGRVMRMTVDARSGEIINQR
jgi:uncharacterized membrane protein YkoI